MSYKVGDPLFSAQALPTTVTKGSKETGRISLNKDPKQVNHDHRHGYLRDMTQNVRVAYNQQMDELADVQDTRQKIAILAEQVAQLHADDDPEKRSLAKYLRAELSHIMNTSGVQPRHYNIPAELAPD